MPKLQITQQQRLPSGQIGALRIDPHISDPAFQAEAAKGQALSSVGKSITKASGDIIDAVGIFRERRRELNDNTAMSENERALKSEMTAFLDSAKTRNDSHNIEAEFNALSKKLKAASTKHEKFSLSGQRVMGELADDYLELSRIDMNRIVARRDLKDSQIELGLSQRAHIENDREDLALEGLQEAHGLDIIDSEQLVKLTEELPQKVLHSRVSKLIQAEPWRTDEILSQNPGLDNKNFTDLKRFGDNRFSHKKAETRNGIYTNQELALTTPDFNLEKHRADLQAAVDINAMTTTEAVKSMDIIEGKIESKSAEDVMTILNTIDQAMLLFPEMTNEQATELFGLVKEYPTLETKVRLTQSLRKYSALTKAQETKESGIAAEGEKKTNDTLAVVAKYIADLEADNLFGSRNIDENGLDITDKEFRKKLSTFTKANPRFFFGTTEEEATEANQAMIDEVLKQRQADNSLRNSVHAAAKRLAREGKSIEDIEKEIDAMIRGPAAQKVLRDALP